MPPLDFRTTALGETEPSPRRESPPSRRWLNRTVLVAAVTSALGDLAHEMASVVLPGFFAALGMPAITLGVVEGIADAVSSGAKLGSGYLAVRFGHRKWLAVLGYALTTVGQAAAVDDHLCAGGRVHRGSRCARTRARRGVCAGGSKQLRLWFAWINQRRRRFRLERRRRNIVDDGFAGRRFQRGGPPDGHRDCHVGGNRQ